MVDVVVEGGGGGAWSWRWCHFDVSRSFASSFLPLLVPVTSDFERKRQQKEIKKTRHAWRKAWSMVKKYSRSKSASFIN